MDAINKQQVIDQINALTADGEFSQKDVNYLINYLIANGDMTGTPRDLIQIRRGNAADLPNLAQGEMAFTLDEEQLYVGGLNGNVSVGMKYYTDPKMYGALADGYRDDSIAMQKAIDSLPNGGVIVLDGNYLIGDVTVNYEGITFLGLNGKSTITVKTGTTGMKVVQNFVNFENVDFLSQGTKTDGKNTNGLLFEKPSQGSMGFARLSNVGFQNFSGYGLKGVNILNFDYNMGYNKNNNICFHIDRDAGKVLFSTTVNVKNVWFTDSTVGIQANYCYRSMFEMNIFERNDYGMKINAGDSTLIRNYFEKNYIKGVDSLNSGIQDLYNYTNSATDVIDILHDGNVPASDRGYSKSAKNDYIMKRLGIMSNFGKDVKYLAAYGGNNNIGLQYGESVVPTVRGKNLLDPSAWVANRLAEFKGFDRAQQGLKVEGTTGGDNTYGVKQDIVLNAAKQYVVDLATTTVKGGGIQFIKVGSLTVENGQVFTPPADGVNTVKCYGQDASGTPFECYIQAFTLCEVAFDPNYRAISNSVIAKKQHGRGVVHLAAPPTTGYWGVGEIVWNTAPTAGGNVGWICTVEGNPGTWKSFGTIQA